MDDLSLSLLWGLYRTMKYQIIFHPSPSMGKGLNNAWTQERKFSRVTHLKYVRRNCGKPARP